MLNTKPQSASAKLALVTGASTGIGYELAATCARNGFDVIIVANEPRIHAAAEQLRRHGTNIEPVEADLSDTSSIDRLMAVIGERHVDALFANAATGLGGRILNQDFTKIRHVIDTNITGTVYLIQRIGREMRRAGRGRILITGSIAGFSPGAFNAIYNATKAFIDSFAWAMREELRDSGVTVTCLMPGATRTDFFRRAGLLDTKLGRAKKDDPAVVAQTGFDAMMRGDGDVVPGWHNKFQAAIANITPASLLARQHRKLAQSDSDRTSRSYSSRGQD